MKKVNINKRLAFLLMGLNLLLSGSLWYRSRIMQERERERELFHKATYGTTMHFAVTERGLSSFVCTRLRLNRRRPDDVQYTEIAFVHSSKEAIDFGEYVLVAWPRDNVYVDGSPNPIRGTQWVLDAVNEAILRSTPDIDFRDYGLPGNEITIADIVDRWEIVNELIWKYIYDKQTLFWWDDI